MSRQALTRITLTLPAPKTQPQFLLVTDIITYLVDMSGGVTVSADLPPVFEGWWRPDEGKPTDHLFNLLLISDTPLDLDAPSLVAAVDALKRRCQQDFDEDIIWLTLHTVHRVTTDDYRR